MKDQAELYHIYNNRAFKLVRVAFFAAMYGFAIVGFLHYQFPKVYLFMLSFYVMLEVFFTYKLGKVKPHRIVGDDTTFDDTATLETLEYMLFTTKTSSIVHSLLDLPNIQFLLKKAGVSSDQIQLIDIPKANLEQTSHVISKRLGGVYVTTTDIMAAYLTLTEPTTRLLFTKGLKEEEFDHIVAWTRYAYKEEEITDPQVVTFWGEGIGEDWVTGWTYETRKYVTDFTKQVMYERPSLMWRHTEYDQLTRILSSKGKNSALLIGEPGTGKRALAQYLSMDCFTGKVGGNLYHQRFYELGVGSLIAGVQNAGDLEARLQPLMNEIAHAGNIILFVEDLENLVGASTFHTDLSGAFLPYLEHGSIRMVATVTPGSYKEFIEPRQNFSNVFENIRFEEPGKEETIEILFKKAPEIENKNNISLTYKAIMAAIDYSQKYNPDHVLPGSAIALLDYVASSNVALKKYSVDEHDVIKVIEEQTHIAVESPQGEEKDVLLHLEARLHERVIGQDEAINGIAQAMRRLRSGMVEQVRPISFLFLGPTGVGKTETARALASLYFGGEDKMIRLDMSEYTTEASINRLLGAAPGQGLEQGELTEKVHEHPFSLVLLDEFEKAHPEILNLFLQVFEDGRLTDNHGKTVSFANTIIIATSNAGSEFIREKIAAGISDRTQFRQELLNQLQSLGIFKPELLNRFDEIVAFSPLGDKEVNSVVTMLLANLTREVQHKDIFITYDQSVVNKIINEGFDPQFGARPLRRFIQDHIEDAIAQKMLRDEIKRGDHILVSTDEHGNIVITQSTQ